MNCNKDLSKDNLKFYENRIMNIYKNISDVIGIFEKCNVKKFYIGGGSLVSNTPNDIDIFLHSDDISKIVDYIKENNSFEILCETLNAITLKSKKYTIQLCNYYKDSLELIVESFDFAHIKIGCEFKYETSMGIVSIISNFEKYEPSLYISEDFIVSAVNKNTFYTGSEYPLSSLIRIFKYIERGEYSGRYYYNDILKILLDIKKRGYVDYDDFKKQIDSIDLGLLESDFNTDLFIKFFDEFKK